MSLHLIKLAIMTISVPLPKRSDPVSFRDFFKASPQGSLMLRNRSESDLANRETPTVATATVPLTARADGSRPMTGDASVPVMLRKNQPIFERWVNPGNLLIRIYYEPVCLRRNW